MNMLSIQIILGTTCLCVIQHICVKLFSQPPTNSQQLFSNVTPPNRCVGWGLMLILFAQHTKDCYLSISCIIYGVTRVDNE